MTDEEKVKMYESALRAIADADVQNPVHILFAIGTAKNVLEEGAAAGEGVTERDAVVAWLQYSAGYWQKKSDDAITPAQAEVHLDRASLLAVAAAGIEMGDHRK